MFRSHCIPETEVSALFDNKVTQQEQRSISVYLSELECRMSYPGNVS